MSKDNERRFAVSSRTGVHIGLWSNGKIAAEVAAENPGNTIEEYLRADHVDALEAQASAEGFDRGVKEAQPIVESLRAELHSLYDAIGLDPLDLENGHDNARAAIDALLKAEREKALREALTACDKALFDMQAANPSRHDALPYMEDGCDACKDAIEALIEKDATDG